MISRSELRNDVRILSRNASQLEQVKKEILKSWEDCLARNNFVNQFSTDRNELNSMTIENRKNGLILSVADYVVVARFSTHPCCQIEYSVFDADIDGSYEFGNNVVFKTAVTLHDGDACYLSNESMDRFSDVCNSGMITDSFFMISLAVLVEGLRDRVEHNKD